MIVSPIIIAIFSASERAAMDTAREGYLNSVNLNLHTSFPYLVLNVVNDTARPRNPGFQVMHWHEDLQFICVLQGEIEVRTLSSSFRVCAGEGTFLNQNVVHEARKKRPLQKKRTIYANALPAKLRQTKRHGPPNA